ncbi:hypothetical protein ACOSQ4_021640 [Xanthoceras sorbifolium]
MMVGDNVGYCAARGVDLFGSIAAQRCKIKVSVRILSIRGTHDSSMKGTYQRFNGTVSERLLCYNSTTVLVYRWLLYIEQAPSARLNFAYVGCSTSHGTNVTAGVNLGLESTALPVWHSCSKMGMLSTTVYVLTMDMFGPIADNAGGMVQMRQQPKSVREISDILDALHFCSRTLRTVGRTSQEIVNEVRRQFIKWPDIMEYKERPDYGRCVAIVASASLREMIKPGALAIILPILIGHDS